MAVHRSNLDDVALRGQLHLSREVAQKEELPRLVRLQKARRACSSKRREVGRELHVVLKRERALSAQLRGPSRSLLMRVEAAALPVLRVWFLHQEVHAVREPHRCELCERRLHPLRPRLERDALPAASDTGG